MGLSTSTSQFPTTSSAPSGMSKQPLTFPFPAIFPSCTIQMAWINYEAESWPLIHQKLWAKLGNLHCRLSKFECVGLQKKTLVRLIITDRDNSQGKNLTSVYSVQSMPSLTTRTPSANVLFFRFCSVKKSVSSLILLCCTCLS